MYLARSGMRKQIAAYPVGPTPTDAPSLVGKKRSKDGGRILISSASSHNVWNHEVTGQ